MRFTIVGCRNADGLHTDSRVDYLVYRSVTGTEIIRNPTFSLLRKLVGTGENQEKVKLVWKPCPLCTSRGIKGFTHLKSEEVIPLDPFETGGPRKER